MAVPLAVIDPLPVYRQGIAAILASSGLEVQMPTDVVGWTREHPHGLILLSVLSNEDWDVLDTLCLLHPRPPIIAVTSDRSGDSGARALRHGARSVLAREADPAAVERAVVATVAGESIMPTAVANALCSTRSQVQVGRPALSAEQVSWLRDLAAGRTVAALAKEAGYSERAMYRFLRSVYEQLGVRTRIEAIVQMRDAGWLTGEIRTAGRPGRAG